jgi:anti-sigma regulatory factor (Ser/Thr protein kinase)
MKELSLNILDITKNSTAARATDITISLVTDAKGILTLTISDNGCGMDEETLKRVADPFYTTRTTRKVGLGIPLLRLAAEQTGGKVTIESTTDEIYHGTKITATFDTLHIDFCPVGDIISSICVLISGNPEIDFVFVDETPERLVRLDTKELRAVLGDVSLAEYEVIKWIEEYLKSQYNQDNI